MPLTRFALPFSLLAALSVAGCRQASTTDTSAAAAPGFRHESHVQAGGVAPPSQTFTPPGGAGSGDAKEGASLFTTMNCDACHSGDGSGLVGPSLIDGRWRYGGSDADVYASIYFGRPKGMPAYGSVMSSEAIWSIMAYLKSQPVPAVVPTISYEEMARKSAAPAAAPANSSGAK